METILAPRVSLMYVQICGAGVCSGPKVNKRGLFVNVLKGNKDVCFLRSESYFKDTSIQKREAAVSASTSEMERLVVSSSSSSLISELMQ